MKRAIALMAALWIAPLAAALSVEPTTLTFVAQDQQATVRVMANGDPLPAAEIRGVRFLVGEHSYNHMVDIRKERGAVVVAPTDRLEIGVYDLVIDTTRGQVVVMVSAPLSALPDSIEARAGALGMSVEEYRRELGLETRAVREDVNVSVAPVYYVGQSMRVEMEAPADRAYVWRVNDAVAKQGTGPHTFTHAFDEPGEYVVAYTERRDGVTVASTVALVQVALEPAVPRTLAAGDELALQAPPGFDQYAWELDGVVVGNDAIFRRAFDAPGEYRLLCIARSADHDQFRKVQYHITVTQ